MGITNWLVHRTMRKEAKRLAAELTTLYPKPLARSSEALDANEIRRMKFDDADFEGFSESTRELVAACCITVNGLCYLLAMNGGKLTGFTNLRSLQFTKYVDRELESLGFPKQTIEDKRKILRALELDIDGWERWSGDAT